MTAWITLKDNEISNQWRYGDYLIKYESTTYGMQYNIYRKGKLVDSCQTVDGAKKKVEERHELSNNS